eukprot:2474120-Rhodomonas_salina.1
MPISYAMRGTDVLYHAYLPTVCAGDALLEGDGCAPPILLRVSSYAYNSNCVILCVCPVLTEVIAPRCPVPA